MLEGLVKIVFWIIKALGDALLLPITLVINALLPSFADSIQSLEVWLDANFWTYIHFVKQCMINIGIPQFCFTFVISYYVFIIGLWAGTRVYIFAYNLYARFKP